MNKVTGVVQAIGEKFSGSLKVNDVWYSNVKGFKNPAVKGDAVELTLQEWNSNDKSGVNIVNVEVKKASAKAEVHKEAVKESLTTERDFDSENRGKVRHGLTVALVPMLAQNLITLEKAKELIDSLVPYVMGK